MLAQQRQASILDRVRRTGGARVADLVRVLGVSDMTIRRDIEALAERGLVAKVHGGLAALLALLLAAHTGAALRHHYVKRDTVLTRMLPWKTP